MSFTLKEATIEDIKERFDLLESKKPHSIMTLLILKSYVKYPVLHKNVFISKDCKYSSLIVVADVMPGGIPPTINIYWDPEELEEDILKQFLKNVPTWNWCEPFVVHCIVEPLYSKLIRILSDVELSGRTLEPQSEGGVMMKMTKENLNNFDLPDEYKMDRLYSWHTPYAFTTWYYSKLQNLESFSKKVEFLPSVAIFKKNDDIKTSNPVAFMVKFEFGMLGLTFTAEEHRKKELGSIVETKLAEAVLEQDEMAIIWVSGGPSLCEFHEKVGYCQIYEGGGWIFFLKKGKKIDDYLNK